jgi:2-oxoglutarate ferredoxin oxidoreductase subunit beta
VATGDGDCCSIGAGHWVHAIRYNMDMTVMLFDNAVYGLTKNQTSPTTPPGIQDQHPPPGRVAPGPEPPHRHARASPTCPSWPQTVDWNPIDKGVARQFPNHREHDPADLAGARDIAQDQSHIPVGLLYHNPDAPCYEDLSSRGGDMTPARKLAGLDSALDDFTI